jgi:hypothetical protein
MKTSAQSFLKSILALLVGALSVASCQAQVTATKRAQVRTIPKVAVFSGKAATQVPQRPRANRSYQRSSPIDLSAIRAAVKGASGKDVKSTNEFVTLTPIQGSVANKGYLEAFGDMIYSTESTDTGKAGFIYLDNRNHILKAISVHIKPVAGQVYLLDFDVVLLDGGEVTTLGPGGQSDMNFPDQGPQHILVMLNAADAEWKNISIVPKASMYFLSCNVTTIQ